MLKWKLLGSIVLMCSASVHAEIYKCTVDGVETFSQVPCAEDAQSISVTPPAKLSSAPLNEADLIDQCVAYFKRAGDFKDPDSIKVEGHFFDWLQDDSGARRVLQIKVNAKNSYGAYAGGEYRTCFLNYNGTKMSDNQYLIKG
ncbi:DUF4124 domain-containing protein [Shewanella sp. SP1S2-4]|uniref:DUF4124 domain-containing protein n=1 Tax=Shewanella sp. SP1S2-4 TaxID=3063537 RepID=UPI00288E9D5D|nr:DUF4124 domain-containing protein [Shewanella sp. SP1S2-4]MDT3319273.1 DUF4124 domain-containing protein [Shewanella sp. SP1S2-4]